jgi:transcription elongation factor GreB
MVRLAGIEPTTPWFVAKYSIQLSYSRAMHRIIAAF